MEPLVISDCFFFLFFSPLSRQLNQLNSGINAHFFPFRFCLLLSLFATNTLLLSCVGQYDYQRYRLRRVVAARAHHQRRHAGAVPPIAGPAES